ncbi:hypothetical protein RhiirA1_389596 [Rhizophagus irregularis]|uniref:Uncharacterized protein n=1 Tax=Rhizophagus irregularis TaxID=588596 RepID=A0A2I1DTB0_9GLOM|nr:hypothetical protein RhiirA1_389596 [Rhizophagus irregularis]PKY13085.1 hypothetical protein RhiirB3_378998 [Rhizophagus irregularis]
MPCKSPYPNSNHYGYANTCGKKGGTWCQQCRYFNVDIAISIARERGSECLSTEYININSPMHWKCAKGNEWTAPLASVRNKSRWCPQCSGNVPCGLMNAKEIACSRGVCHIVLLTHLMII